MMAVVGTLAFNFQVVFPLFVTHDIGGDDTTFTILLSVISLGSLAGALATARRKHIDIRMVGLASLAFGVPSWGAMARGPASRWLFPIGILVGVGSISFLTASTAIVQVQADPTMRGRVLALQAMVFLGKRRPSADRSWASSPSASGRATAWPSVPSRRSEPACSAS